MVKKYMVKKYQVIYLYLPIYCSVSGNFGSLIMSSSQNFKIIGAEIYKLNKTCPDASETHNNQYLLCVFKLEVNVAVHHFSSHKIRYNSFLYVNYRNS